MNVSFRSKRASDGSSTEVQLPGFTPFAPFYPAGSMTIVPIVTPRRQGGRGVRRRGRVNGAAACFTFYTRRVV
ncbi:protein of unknown function [Kyrpidia spormannii]|uniref:Uncharacterized protein n=1 Tax=Kyrpidia spormannii TaxID=2055160 RepID=A0ACA8Z6U6_9BACL|nr:protein of unknown function [Kyrpidia spormannii]